MRIHELETPVLTADLDAVERNIAGMQAYCDEHALALRPHIKTHKLPQIAAMQIDAGAHGITCQKLGEAEVFAGAGFDDILLTFPLVGRAKAERLAALVQRVQMSVVGDSAAVAKGLSDVLAEAGVEVAFLVECDTGLGRTGVQTPEEAADGEQVTIVPNHACVTANMHDEVVVHRGGEIVDTLPTAARGKVR